MQTRQEWDAFPTLQQAGRNTCYELIFVPNVYWWKYFFPFQFYKHQRGSLKTQLTKPVKFDKEQRGK